MANPDQIMDNRRVVVRAVSTEIVKALASIARSEPPATIAPAACMPRKGGTSPYSAMPAFGSPNGSAENPRTTRTNSAE